MTSSILCLPSSRVALQATSASSASSKSSSGNKKKSRQPEEVRPFAGDIFLRFQHKPLFNKGDEDDEEEEEEVGGMEETQGSTEQQGASGL